MHRLTDSARDVALFDCAATRQVEAAALAAVPPGTLVRRAGLAVARLALALAPHGRRWLVLTGPGNNGADGLEAAMALQAAGHCAQVVTVVAPASRDAQAALVRARQAGLLVGTEWPADLGAFDLAIDALLGIGISRAPDGAIANAIERLNSAAVPVLAIDVPSGLDADTGQPVGGHAVRAGATLTMLTAKPGLFTGQGRDHAGDVWCDDLGVALTAGSPPGLDDAGMAQARRGAAADAPSPSAFGTPVAWLSGRDRVATGAAPRRHAQHKGSFGQVVVVGGAAGMSGAAWLAARAALVAGAGRVYASLLDDATTAPPWPELMRRSSAWAEDRALLESGTWVCGCGGGDAVSAALPAVLSCHGPLVLDADGLNAVARDSVLASLLTARGARDRVTVLTPHPLEAARLLGCDIAAVLSDRPAVARELAERLQAVVVLKGSGSIIAAPGCTPFINGTGSPALATAGTGDVLAGWIGGLLAAGGDASHGRPGALRRVIAAVALHGLAADRCAGRIVLTAAALIDAMAEAAGAAR